MKVKLSLLGAVAIAMTLALTGLLNGTTPVKALAPDPVQPFGPEEIGGLDTTALDRDIINYTVTDIVRGERLSVPWIYTPYGFKVNTDEAIDDDTVIGTVTSELDALCNSTGPTDIDILAKAGGIDQPLDWIEATTDVEGTADEYLLAIMPPFDWLLRHRADVTTLWLPPGTVPPKISTTNVINTVYVAIPFSPGADGTPDGGGTFTATTRVGGAPQFPTAAQAICLDSPQKSTSLTGVEGTPVYSTPDLMGDGADSIDDATGLYARFTAFYANTQWNLPDNREPRGEPPSMPGDNDYRERTVQLQCFWIDEDGCEDEDCDDNDDGWISAVESQNDSDMPAGIDADGDCLAAAGDAQPGRPVDTDDTLNGVLCDYGAAAGSQPLQYSESPNVVQYDTAMDQDCDGLLDGVEAAWGSDPNDADADDDGASDFVELFNFTDPTDDDTDGDGLLDKPDDDYVAVAAGSAEAGEAVNADDNCPFLANADQANNDGQRRPNGAQIGGDWASNPMADKMGDECDTDDDNDWVNDVSEQIREDPPGTADPTTTTNADTDGDACLDGVEGYTGSDPTSPGSKCPANLNLAQVTFFRACRWNVPANGYEGLTTWNAEGDDVDDDVEWDPDDDGVVCGVVGGTNPVDPDNDNGTGTGAAAKDEYPDNVEIKGYGTMAANKDSDGDKCQDWIEITDVNGDRSANISDVLLIARRAFNLLPPSDSDPVFDINKDGSLNLSDAVTAARNSSLVKTHTLCLSDTVVD